MPIESGVLQGSVPGPLIFLFYINDLKNNVISNIRLFADGSSLFARVTDLQETRKLLTTDLNTLSSWPYQWEMKFNPYVFKQAVEVVISVKRKPDTHPNLALNARRQGTPRSYLRFATEI